MTSMRPSLDSVEQALMTKLSQCDTSHSGHSEVTVLWDMIPYTQAQIYFLW